MSSTALPLKPITGQFTRSVTGSAEELTSQIDSMELPFQDMLTKWANVDDDDLTTLVTNMKNMLNEIKNLTASMVTLLLNPSGYNDAYTSSLLTSLTSQLSTNLLSGGTGLPVQWEIDWQTRANNRILYIASRESRRILSEVSKRVPYAGQIADHIIEAERNIIQQMGDTSREIDIKQAELTYQNTRQIIAEALQHEQMGQQDFQVRRARALQAYSKYDELNIQNTWNYYEFIIKKALAYIQGGIDFTYKMGIGADQLSFENWFKMASLMAEGQLRISGMITQLSPSGQTLA